MIKYGGCIASVPGGILVTRLERKTMENRFTPDYTVIQYGYLMTFLPCNPWYSSFLCNNVLSLESVGRVLKFNVLGQTGTFTDV
jgi:hypothetical protein